MAELATGQAAAGAPPDPPGPPGPPRPPSPWGPTGTYLPYEEKDEESDEEPPPKRQRPVRRVWATATIPSRRQNSRSDQVEFGLADTLTALRRVLDSIAGIELSLSNASHIRSAAMQRQREHLRNRGIELRREARIFRVRAASQAIELLERNQGGLQSRNLGLISVAVRTGDAAEEDFTASPEALRHAFFSYIDEDLRWFFEEHWTGLENRMNERRQNAFNNSYDRDSPLYDTSTLSQTSNSMGNGLVNSTRNRRGSDLRFNRGCESRTNNSINPLASYTFGRRRSVRRGSNFLVHQESPTFSETHSYGNDDLSPRSQYSAAITGVSAHRGHGDSASHLSSGRRRVRSSGHSSSHQLRAPTPSNNQATPHTTLIREPRSPPLSMLQDPPRPSLLSILRDPTRQLGHQSANFAAMPHRPRQPLTNGYQSARQQGAANSTQSQGASTTQNPANGISASANDSALSQQYSLPMARVLQREADQFWGTAMRNVRLELQSFSFDGFHDALQQEEANNPNPLQETPPAEDIANSPSGDQAHRCVLCGFNFLTRDRFERYCQRCSIHRGYPTHVSHPFHSAPNANPNFWTNGRPLQPSLDDDSSSLSPQQHMQMQMQMEMQRHNMAVERQAPPVHNIAELERRLQAQLGLPSSSQHGYRVEANGSNLSQGASASPNLANDPRSLAPPQNVGPSSWTNGRPLQPSIDSFDDMGLQQNPSYCVPRSMTFRIPRQQSPHGRLSPEPPRFAGPSSWTNGRPLLAFNDIAGWVQDASSETEDLARQSRGPIIDVLLCSNFPIQDGRQLFSRPTNHVLFFLGNVLLTDDILCRGDGEVTRMGAGESYRPAARPRSPPRTDSFRGDRDRDRSPRRERARTPPTDSWHPSSRDRSPRRRSRTPPRRERSPLRDNWRSRQRSPIRARTPPRRFSPRRDEDRRPRSPVRRDERRRSRSPYNRERPAPRARSPLPRRSPPAGPRASYRTRSRSPERRDDRIPTGPSSANWRRRSPSPQARDSERSSERTSGNSSRRSSPPIHPERLHLTQASTRDSRPRSPPTRDRSPQLAYRDKDSTRSTPRERSPVRPVAPRSPPRGPAGFRAPTGPSGGRNFIAPSPSVSSSNTPASMSAHNRSENAGPVVPPSGPRGYVPPVRGAYSIRGGRGTFGSDRVSRPDASLWGAAPPTRPAAEASIRGSIPVSRPIQPPSPSIPSGPAASVPTGPSGGIPTGPRAGIPSRPSLQHSSSSYNSRPNPTLSNSSGPRPHPAMANLPQIIPSGRIDPTASGIPSDIAARLKRKEEEAETLREELHAKQEKLRQGLKGWDKLSRDSQSMGLRSELSERHVRMLAGEGVGGAAF